MGPNLTSFPWSWVQKSLTLQKNKLKSPGIWTLKHKFVAAVLHSSVWKKMQYSKCIRYIAGFCCLKKYSGPITCLGSQHVQKFGRIKVDCRELPSKTQICVFSSVFHVHVAVMAELGISIAAYIRDCQTHQERWRLRAEM